MKTDFACYYVVVREICTVIRIANMISSSNVFMSLHFFMAAQIAEVAWPIQIALVGQLGQPDQQ